MQSGMFRRVLPELALFCATIAAVLFGTATAPAQVRIPAAALASEADYNAVLQKGHELEQERRWIDALSHYESATRQFPAQEDLEQRLRIARLHYDVARRYADVSFLESVNNISEREALDLYAEVLLKITTHHVDNPDWQHLLQQGSLAVDVAFTEPAFLQKNLPQATTDQVTALRRELYRHGKQYTARSRHEARDIAWSTAQLARSMMGISTQAVLMEYIGGAMNGLDRYSSYLTGGQLDDVFSQIEGNFVGLGIELKADDQTLLIVDVIPESPAESGGIRAGDRIVQVDGKSTNDISTDEAAEMLKGPEGSHVHVVVRSPDGSHRLLDLERNRVDVPSVVDIKMIDAEYGTAYMRLASFQKTTSRDVDAALWQLHRQGMRSLIIDLRGNPGGLLTASVEAADKFVSQGPIVSTRGRSSREDFDYKAHAVGTWRVPLIVLIDGDSASASEIFAGAIRDHQRGTVMGERSYGKGSVQGIFPLNSYKSGVRLTTAKFYSPAGHAISKRGVLPDVVVHQAAKPDTDNPNLADTGDEDTVLQASVRYARTQLTQRP